MPCDPWGHLTGSGSPPTPGQCCCDVPFLQSFHLGAKRDGENIYGSDAKNHRKEFHSSGCLFVRLRGPLCFIFKSAENTTRITPHTFQASIRWFLLFVQASVHLRNFPLEICMETSSLCCLLLPLIAVSRCSLSWKRHPDASLLGVSLSLGR